MIVYNICSTKLKFMKSWYWSLLFLPFLFAFFVVLGCGKGDNKTESASSDSISFKSHGSSYSGGEYIVHSSLYVPKCETRNVFQIIQDSSTERMMKDSVRSYLVHLFVEGSDFPSCSLNNYMGFRGVVDVDSIYDEKDSALFLGLMYQIDTEVW